MLSCSACERVALAAQHAHVSVQRLSRRETVRQGAPHDRSTFSAGGAVRRTTRDHFCRLGGRRQERGPAIRLEKGAGACLSRRHRNRSRRLRRSFVGDAVVHGQRRQHGWHPNQPAGRPDGAAAEQAGQTGHRPVVGSFAVLPLHRRRPRPRYGLHDQPAG